MSEEVEGGAVMEAEAEAEVEVEVFTVAWSEKGDEKQSGHKEPHCRIWEGIGLTS